MEDSEKMLTSEDEDSSSNEEDKQLEIRTEELERQISDNKYLYDVHLELVDLYRKLGDLKSMRAAYQRFANYFPLTPTIWLVWIRGEIKLANSTSEKKYILSLFDKAVEDYLSIDLWFDYVQFCIGNCETDQTYAVLERGLHAIGLHTSQGSLLWNTLREFELGQLSLQPLSSEKWHQQATKVADAFKRQLSVPLLEMNNTYNEWQQWHQSLPTDHKIDVQPVEWGYQKALKLLEIYTGFEDRLLIIAEKEDEVLGAYQEYIDAVTDPATIITLYERAVAQISLNSELWRRYCLYVLKLGDISDKVGKNALRNCPWCEELWVLRLRILEQRNCSDKEAVAILEQGLAAIVPSPGLNLWLAYLGYVRRSLGTPEYLHKIFQQAAEHVGEIGDPTCMILRLQARLYANQGNMDKARRVWSRILHEPTHKNAVNAWLEYSALERRYGDAQKLRNIYKRALTSCTDRPQCIAEDWLMYERECGSLNEVLECEERCSKISSVIENDASRRNDDKRKHNPESNERGSKVKRQKTSRELPIRPRKQVFVSDIDSEKSVFLSNMHEQVNLSELQALFPNATAICIPNDRKGNSRCYAYVQFSEQAEVEAALSRDREPLDGRPLFISKCLLDQTQRQKNFKYSTASEDKKLFVRGLPISYSQEEVENIFKPYGAIAARLVLHRSGRSKGLAYIEFKEKDQAKQALEATDKLEVEGHGISVAISAPPKKTTGPSFEMPPNFTIRQHARNRLEVPLLPRSVQIKKLNTGNDNGAGGSNSKTNADFRKMLFDKS